MESQTAIAEMNECEPVAATELPRFRVLGVRIDNVTRRLAFETLERAIRRREGRAKSVYFVNAHTLNVAAADPSFRETLNSGDYVFADGTGVRWAARLQGVRVAENMVGTDFVPQMFQATADRGYSYFMLGADEATIPAAAAYARRSFPGWELAGYRHGFLTDRRLTDETVERINSLRPDVLLVGMGNPIQEEWIGRNLSRLDAPVCMGVGGLFDYWAGNVSRAPRWLRRLGHEWLWRLFQQPRLKARRYLIGNPLFLARVLRDLSHDRRRRR
ncbi:MAG: WecB/TagA/CpsF family glycosyltransferase [Pirellulales bacterium]|nr:WecB/TagA/CpsF family glycosyltransferase [Pirellulales bacterium]